MQPKSNQSKSKHIQEQKQKEENTRKKSNLSLNFTTLNFKIIDEINLARTCPSEYAAKLERISTTIINDRKIKIGDTEMNLTEGPDIFEEAIQYCLNIDPLEPLQLVDGLCQSADELLSVLIIQEGVNMNELQPTIYGLEKRLDHFGVYFGEFCELLNYGISDPELVVLYFVLCDGDESRRDRKIIFNSQLQYVGISSGVLPSEKTCTVINSVQYFYNPGEEIPENMLNRYTYHPNLRDKFNNMKLQSNEAYAFKKLHYKEHFEMIYEEKNEPKPKKIKRTKEVKKKIKDKVTGKEVIIVKKTITYDDGEEEVQTYTL